MSSLDALRAAESIVANAALTLAPTPTAGLELPAAVSPHEAIEARIVSVERGVVTVVEAGTGLTRRLVAPPLIAEFLKHTFGNVHLQLDDRDHILFVEQ